MLIVVVIFLGRALFYGEATKNTIQVTPTTTQQAIKGQLLLALCHAIPSEVLSKGTPKPSKCAFLFEAIIRLDF